MGHPLYKLKAKIRNRFSIRHNKGHGIHSPSLYRFISTIIQGEHPYYCFNQIEALNKSLYSSHHQYIKDSHCGQMLFRMIQDAQLGVLLELGSTTGMETQYMAMANPKARCIGVIRSAEWFTTVQNNFKALGLNQIEIYPASSEKAPEKIIDELETLDFVFFNHLSGPQETERFFLQCLSKKKKHSIFVFKDIHQSPERAKVWQNIRKNEKVQVSIDLYSLGIVLFNPELVKRNYNLRTKKRKL